MSFIQENLAEGEQVVVLAQIHPIIFMDTILWLLGAVAIVLYGNSVNIDESVVKFACAALLFIALLRLSKAMIYKLSTEMAVTNTRIIAKFGLVERETIEIPLSKIESVLIDQSALERVFGSGSVGVRGTGTGMAPVKFIDNPIAFRNGLNGAIAALKSGH